MRVIGVLCMHLTSAPDQAITLTCREEKIRLNSGRIVAEDSESIRKGAIE